MTKNKIEVTLMKKEDYMNPFNHKRISTELNGYILDECRAFHPKDSLEIHIYHYFSMTKEEKKELIDMIRENYGIDVQELYILIERRRAINLFIFLMGIAFLFFYIFLNVVPVVSELILIFGWVCIWESIYNLLFGGLRSGVTIRKLKKLTTCKIYFEEKKGP